MTSAILAVVVWRGLPNDPVRNLGHGGQTSGGGGGGGASGGPALVGLGIGRV